jgi:DNA repair protein REV1
MAADTRQTNWREEASSSASPALDHSPAKRVEAETASFTEGYEDLEDDETFALALASQTAKLTPELRKILTGGLNSAEKRKREEEGDAWRGVEPAKLGVDPLRDGSFGHAGEREEDEEDVAYDEVSQSRYVEKQDYMASEAYKPNTFGDFRSYMKNKRLKLKVQEKSISEDDPLAGVNDEGKGRPTYLPLFTGTNIYINGHTNPPYGELRRLIHLHDGELMPYLDTKSPVTHIIASNLTAKKRIEFKDYRVVRPEWITESIKQERRLDWRDFRCSEDASGAMSMGALRGQSAVGQTDVEREIKEEREKLEEARREATKGDWRASATGSNDESSSATAQQLRAYAQSGFGAGTENGVGPWGRASRQKTLGGWARKPSDREKMHQVDDDKSLVSATKGTDVEEDREKPSNVAETIVDQADLEESLRPPGRKLPSVHFDLDKAISQTAVPDDTTPKTPSKLRHSTTNAAEVSPASYANVGTDPASKKAAAAGGLLDVSHPYAARPSNRKAAELMASPSWRERNTATSEGFLQGYFGKSRLHHLSTWKSEMREMVAQALREAKREHGSVDLPAGMRRVIFHIDFDAFFVSVGLRSRPELRDKAVVVCHADSDTSGNSSTSEIASCNYVAREFGVRNGMSLGQARRFCPSVQPIPYDFVAYNDIAIRFYTLLLSHADAIEAVSIDEALIDVSFLLQDMRKGVTSTTDDQARKALTSAYIDHHSSQGERWTEEKQLAEALRDQIRALSGCEASIGIGSNVQLARLATRKAKPGGSFHLRDEDVPPFIDELQIDDLHGVGWSIRNRCRDLYGTTNVGELKQKASKSKFVALFGDKHGVTLWDKLHGKERDALEPIKPRQSCGASINYAIRFKTQDEVRDFVRKLSVEVSNRLKAINMAGRVCCVSLMVRSKDAPIEAPKFLGHGICDTFNRSTPLARLTDDDATIFQTAWKMFAALNVEPDQMRGIGVSLQKLEYLQEGMQVAQRREAGQSMLSFGAAPYKKARNVQDSVTTTLSSQREEADEPDQNTSTRSEAMDDEGPSPPPSPSLGTRKVREIGQHSPPPATQFVVPSDGELDQDVLAALPESIRSKIIAAQNSKMERSASADAYRSPRTPSKPSSTIVTPEKQKDKVNLFERMRAASATPTKKRQLSQRALTTHLSSAPSTPSGSQRRSHAAWEPSWTQIDPAVLGELPQDVQDEILRQVGQAAGQRTTTMRSHTMAGADDSITADVDSAIEALRRSQSISPRKKQAHLDLLGGIRNKQRDGNLKAVKQANARLPSLMAEARAIKASTSVTEHVIDPTRVTDDELNALDIDPAVFAALPLSVQRETLETMVERKARFRSGRHTAVELTKAQQRLALRKNAFPPEEQSKLQAIHPTERMPSIKGATSAQDINDLISKWIGQFAEGGPRDRDVQRFARFLVESLQGTAVVVRDERPRRSTRSSASEVKSVAETNSAPLDGLEKVHDILCAWARTLRQTDWQSGSSKHAWWQALRGVHEQVNAIAREQYGAGLSVKLITEAEYVI